MGEYKLFEVFCSNMKKKTHIYQEKVETRIMKYICCRLICVFGRQTNIDETVMILLYIPKTRTFSL